jgi:CheY-like chemotaxis protein
MPANGSLDQVLILVVEDEPDMAREIATQLRSLGYLARRGSKRPAATAPRS